MIVRWKAAAQNEMNAHLENRIWIPRLLPSGKKAIPCCWVFAQKCNWDGSIEHPKARSVAKEFSQRPGFNYVKTLLLQRIWPLICAVLALEDLNLHSVYILSMVYTQGGKVYTAPSWWSALSCDVPSEQVWYLELSNVFKQEEFTWLQSDASLFLQRKGDVRIIVPVYTHDMTITCPLVQNQTGLSQSFHALQIAWSRAYFMTPWHWDHQRLCKLLYFAFTVHPRYGEYVWIRALLLFIDYYDTQYVFECKRLPVPHQQSIQPKLVQWAFSCTWLLLLAQTLPIQCQSLHATTEILARYTGYLYSISSGAWRAQLTLSLLIVLTIQFRAFSPCIQMQILE